MASEQASEAADRAAWPGRPAAEAHVRGRRGVSLQRLQAHCGGHAEPTPPPGPGRGE